MASNGLLLAAAVLDRRLTGVPIALGMLLNLAGDPANRDTMPVRIEAMHNARGDASA